MDHKGADMDHIRVHICGHYNAYLFGKHYTVIHIIPYLVITNVLTKEHLYLEHFPVVKCILFYQKRTLIQETRI